MSQYALRLPNSLMEHVKKLSRQDRVSMNQFMLSAIAEKASAVATEEYFKHRAARADLAKARAVLQTIQRAGMMRIRSPAGELFRHGISAAASAQPS